MNIEPDTPTPLTDAHDKSFVIDSPGWRRFAQLLERKLRAMTVRAEKAEAKLAFELALNTRLFAQRDEAVAAFNRANALIQKITAERDATKASSPSWVPQKQKEPEWPEATQ